VGQQGKRILVVDDNTDAAGAWGDLLEMLGNSVAIAHDGAEALRIVRAFKPEVCVVDIGCRRWTATSWRGACASRTAWPGRGASSPSRVTGQATDQQRSAEAGFDAHLVKPVNPDLLTRQLHELGAVPNSRPRPRLVLASSSSRPRRRSTAVYSWTSCAFLA